MIPEHLYIHFPFCRRKCAYCALHSRAGVGAAARQAYVAELAERLRARIAGSGHQFASVYFGGGTPAMASLKPLFAALGPHLDSGTEFTVELHPLDVTADLLDDLRVGGVNRISMGLESVEDGVLKAMGRGYGFAEAEAAFRQVKGVFDNAGIDLIVGYPGESAALVPAHARLARWGLRHASAYSLILEERTSLALKVRRREVVLPDDETTLNRLAVVARFFGELGLRRYEISNYALPGFECRHNLAVWRGEDYWGLGEGAHGREGQRRYEGLADGGERSETVTADFDRRERRLFRLRLSEGIAAADCTPGELAALRRQESVGLVHGEGGRYRLTERGTEVADAVMAEL